MFQQDVESSDWVNFRTPLENEPSKMAATFWGVFESFLNTYAPPRTKNVRNEFTLWLRWSVRDLIAGRDKMKKVATKSPQWPAYKVLRNRCSNSMREAIQDYHYGLIEETRNDPKNVEDY